MQKAANTSRFLTESSSNSLFADREGPVGQGGLVHRAILGRVAQAADSYQTFVKLAEELTRLAEQAYGRRDMDGLEETSLVLMNLPLAGARQIGTYYHALTIKRKGKKEEAQSLLQTVAASAPLSYRARAIQSLGAIHHACGEPSEALRLYSESLRVASDGHNLDLLTTLYAYFEISHLQSDDGDHAGSLKTLEYIYPIVQVVSRQFPLYFYSYWANAAYEMGEIGRFDEARAALSIALAWSAAPNYPEWFETRAEIEAKAVSASPSVVAVFCPEAAPSPQPEVERRPEPVAAPAARRSAVEPFSQAPSEVAVIVSARTPSFILLCTTLDRLGRAFRARAPPSCV